MTEAPVGPILHCKGCGRMKPGPDGSPSDLFPCEHCDECPPWRCQDCGEMDSFEASCGCWVSLEGMPLADIKAIFAADGTFSVGGLGSGKAS